MAHASEFVEIALVGIATFVVHVQNLWSVYAVLKGPNLVRVQPYHQQKYLHHQMPSCCPAMLGRPFQNLLVDPSHQQRYWQLSQRVGVPVALDALLWSFPSDFSLVRRVLLMVHLLKRVHRLVLR